MYVFMCALLGGIAEPMDAVEADRGVGGEGGVQVRPPGRQQVAHDEAEPRGPNVYFMYG